MSTRVEHLILGAGPTGLAAAYRLQELGRQDFLVLEAADHPGGLAASFTDDQGFTWDIGGHVQFSHYRYFDDLMERALGADGWLHHQRESWAWMHGRFVPYPVQNNLRYLPREVMWRCLEGFIEANLAPRSTPPDFGSWVTATFGEGFADVFMRPYNFKVWAYPLEELAYGWIGERVAVPDLKRVFKNIVMETDDLSWGPNHTFRFPRHGGTGAIWRSVANLVGAKRVRLRTEVVGIDPEAHSVRLAGGTSLSYGTLLSTMPLDRLTRLTGIEDASGLVHSTSHIVGLGLRGRPPEALRTKCWMYFPEDNCPFYRVTVFSNYSPGNVPDPATTWSLMTETSESPHKPVDEDEIVERTIAGCLATGLIGSREQLLSTWRYRAEYGYPTPSLGRDAILARVLPALEARGIYSRGRFGAWKYEVSNQDHAAMQGVEWVNRVCLQIPEVTLPFPHVANANWGRS